eukprot:TRINITY_DN5547_c0_g1_i3.p1 TRINITY_DN5547_c0_g1~~TRINITY_DN5547_c0_g1_i3.p1  ORF type:complete len:336 (+),score=-26.64 TRINITY_DN5547_c0_g1_i3:713-1720(+)
MQSKLDKINRIIIPQEKLTQPSTTLSFIKYTQHSKQLFISNLQKYILNIISYITCIVSKVLQSYKQSQQQQQQSQQNTSHSYFFIQVSTKIMIFQIHNNSTTQCYQTKIPHKLDLAYCSNLFKSTYPQGCSRTVCKGTISQNTVHTILEFQLLYVNLNATKTYYQLSKNVFPAIFTNIVCKIQQNDCHTPAKHFPFLQSVKDSILVLAYYIILARYSTIQNGFYQLIVSQPSLRSQKSSQLLDNLKIIDNHVTDFVSYVSTSKHFRKQFTGQTTTSDYPLVGYACLAQLFTDICFLNIRIKIQLYIEVDIRVAQYILLLFTNVSRQEYIHYLTKL